MNGAVSRDGAGAPPDRRGAVADGGEAVREAGAVAAARSRWRAAAESAFPALIADPRAYARALEAIGAIAADLRRRDADLPDLAAAMDRSEDYRSVATAAPPGIPMALLVGVACSMRERDLIARRVRDDRRRAIDDARAAGRPWAVLEGPARVEDLTGGATGSACCVHLHLPSGSELRAAVDAWSPEPYRVDVVNPGADAPTGAAFTAREPWLAEVARLRSAVEAPDR